jgi:hypothetical protein
MVGRCKAEADNLLLRSKIGKQQKGAALNEGCVNKQRDSYLYRK